MNKNEIALTLTLKLIDNNLLYFDQVNDNEEMVLEIAKTYNGFMENLKAE